MNCVTVKVYTPGVGQACGEWDSVSSESNWFLRESFLLNCVTFLLALPSLGIPYPMDFSTISGVTHYWEWWAVWSKAGRFVEGLHVFDVLHNPKISINFVFNDVWCACLWFLQCYHVLSLHVWFTVNFAWVSMVVVYFIAFYFIRNACNIYVL